MSSPNPRLLILGAHPDDAEFHAGGISLRYRQLGRTVRWISATDGSAGHHLEQGAPLKARRAIESQQAARLADVEHEVWDFPDGFLTADLKLREKVIREIRSFRPDLVLTHRPWDYHPDHRALGQAVMDACYLVTVPGILRDAVPMNRDPVVAYLADPFRRPIEFQPDRVLDVTAQIPQIVELLAAHESQFFEFLPVSFGASSPVPEERQARLKWLETWYLERTCWRAARWGATPIEPTPQLYEAFELAEHAASASMNTLELLFPGSVLPRTPQ